MDCFKKQKIKGNKYRNNCYRQIRITTKMKTVIYPY